MLNRNRKRHKNNHSYGFFNCKSLENVSIAKSVSYIDYKAFSFIFLEDDTAGTFTIYNPYCKIYDENSQPAVFDKSATLRGYNGSTTQAYAEKYGYKFESLGAPPPLSTGDSDGDDEVTVDDAQNILIAYVEGLAHGGKTGLTKEQTEACDIDGDGEITASDAQYILVFYTENTLAKHHVSWEELLKH